ncbi:UDP-N-acetylmuramoyl-L-alanine--D-glutamate ligase [Deinococcus cellulosilyticus]|uniref:UDP-N-acetylmuramoylalanine--D-glutamate ligase n=1 Tax=Deinococcus cellulosilyticus (strain DSM 18568 / NBRC 106333 / KACC 11606 / 5516J-15) TaxID=1223518 RepID=A0A511MX15_DEIC1|nr:UDP-N-acetylmuramoyl-L-alanine--D-glutamate ligase [Deinococcus cellulosilyticus]GEM45110.1 UDP-N-acetylmuramoylalanine--D-glutamate ligase [Deinococcus cellulosilyticus NBRC 106333 = KACC 11606]
MNALIYGLGRSGRGVARYLKKLGWDAQWMDQKPQPEDLALVSELGFSQGAADRAYTWVIAAPGVPIDHPDLEKLRAQGAKVIGELELGFLTRRTPVIGITGTAGKGGTSVLITQLLRASGLNALIGGNFDPPFLDIIEDAEVAVVEISSFQLERIHTFRPHVAVITNMDVDHLDRHRTIEAYHAAKWRIQENQLSDDTLVVMEELKVPETAKARTITFPRRPEQVRMLSGEVLLEAEALPRGIHPANAQAAIYAVESYLQQIQKKADAAVLRESLLSSEPVKGRNELVATHRGIDFVVDSIATRTIAVKSALEQARAPIVWLVGGRDKGAALEPLQDVVQQKVKYIVGIGEAGAQFAGAFNVPHEVIFEASGDATIEKAVKAASLQLPEGGTVLLAPLGTSFDQFRDYKDRERAFREAVTCYTKEP